MFRAKIFQSQRKADKMTKFAEWFAYFIVGVMTGFAASIME
jgi:hypothetical protein